MATKKNSTAAAIFAAYPKDFLSTREVANALSITPNAVYKRVQRYTIPFDFASNRRLVFLRSNLRAWAQAN